jgi:hypothetical protein
MPDITNWFQNSTISISPFHARFIHLQQVHRFLLGIMQFKLLFWWIILHYQALSNILLCHTRLIRYHLHWCKIEPQYYLLCCCFHRLCELVFIEISPLNHIRYIRLSYYRICIVHITNKDLIFRLSSLITKYARFWYISVQFRTSTIVQAQNCMFQCTVIPCIMNHIRILVYPVRVQH